MPRSSQIQYNFHYDSEQDNDDEDEIELSESQNDLQFSQFSQQTNQNFYDKSQTADVSSVSK